MGAFTVSTAGPKAGEWPLYTLCGDFREFDGTGVINAGSGILLGGHGVLTSESIAGGALINVYTRMGSVYTQRLAAGYSSAATGENSIALGFVSQASEANSIVIGKGLRSGAASQVVVGRFNAVTTEEQRQGVFIVGAGEHSNAHKNALRVTDGGLVLINPAPDIPMHTDFQKGQIP